MPTLQCTEDGREAVMGYKLNLPVYNVYVYFAQYYQRDINSSACMLVGQEAGGDDDDGGGVGHPVVPVVAPQPPLLALLIALSPSSGHVLLPPATCHGNALQATRVP